MANETEKRPVPTKGGDKVEKGVVPPKAPAKPRPVEEPFTSGYVPPKPPVRPKPPPAKKTDD